MIKQPRMRFALLLATLALLIAACGGGEAAAPDAESEAGTASEESSEMMSEEASSEMESESEMMSEEASSETALELPEDGQPGSLSSMTTQPAATAASTNPVLTTLTAAVQAAGLVDTLNGPGPFTIFAPVDDAFAAVPQDDLDALLADQEQLTNVLTYHVVQGQALQADALAGEDSVTVANGGSVSLSPGDDTIDLNGGQATVVFPNIQVANGVVHLIDGVLTPQQ
jgi:transforming growth factor-beta-induced protein